MNHLHTYLYMEKNGIIQVSLDSPGNVYLLDDTEYQNYLEGKEFQGFGGLVRARKKKIRVPGEGKWHLVIDNSNQQESLNVALNITNGSQISENEILDTKTPRKQKKLSHKGKIKQDECSKEQRKLLTKEITKRLKELDEEGLRFLIQQARILVQNQEIEKLNTEIDNYNKNNESYVIGAEPEKKKSGSQKTLIDLEEQSKNTFILVICGARKVLSRLELREIVKMCHARMSDTAFSVKLFEWLKIHRNDILFDARIRTADHPVLVALRRFLRSRYKVKK